VQVEVESFTSQTLQRLGLSCSKNGRVQAAMQKDMARWSGSHKSAGQFGCSACMAGELDCGRRKRVLE
jgi:hypothetical protein